MTYNEAIEGLVEAIAHSKRVCICASDSVLAVFKAHTALATAEKCGLCDYFRKADTYTKNASFCQSCGKPFTDAPVGKQVKETCREFLGIPAIEPLRPEDFQLKHRVRDVVVKLNEVIASHNKHNNGGGK